MTEAALPLPRNPELRAMADCIRALTMDAVQHAGSGHPGMPMGMADIATVLFRDFMKFDPQAPDWPDRDRFVLSNGHGSMLLYSLLYLTGYRSMTIDEIKRLRRIDSRTPGHPERHAADGIETTTGPLGQGIANAVGMALAERVLRDQFGEALVDHHTYVFLGDGCLMEGISQEALSLAGHLGLGKLIAFFDDNRVTIDGPTILAVSDDIDSRFRASNWHVIHIDGHDTEAIRSAIEEARQVTDRPSLIACRTLIGFGLPTRAGTSKAHSDAPGEDEIAGARRLLGWTEPPFVIPDALLGRWRAIGQRGPAQREQWLQRLRAAPDARRQAFERRQRGLLPQGWQQALQEARAQMLELDKDIATRQADGLVLDHLVPVLPELFGGSADLTASNNTKTKGQEDVAPHRPGGDYVHFGVREHAMAAAMNGIALHRGLLPYGGTFLCFSDYCRPAIRLAAMMQAHAIFVMTHDSIGLGEDGPTHQPIEHLSSLRAIPQLDVYRPADPVEVVECWQALLETPDRPALLALSRQPVPRLRTEAPDGNRSARGAYVLADAHGGRRRLTLLSSGSEVHLALQARDSLQAEGIPTAVVSVPSMSRFERQDAEYRRAVLGDADGARVAIEAGVRMSWDRYLGLNGGFVGMHGFGASGSIADVYRKFGITAHAVVQAAHEVLDGQRVDA